MIQSKSLNEIHDYLIYLNNEHQTIKKVKNKEFMIKIRMIKQIIFAEKLSKTIFYKINKAFKSVELLKQHYAILINIKDTDLQADNYFLCYKSDHIFRKCFN